MLTGTLDINALKIYFDGVLILSQTGSVAKSTAFNTLIGAQYSNSGIISNQNFGDIDDVGFWNRALSQCEINDLYDVQLGSQAISAGTNTSVCEGGGFVLNGTGGTNLVWSGGLNNGQTINPTTTTTYYLTGMDSVNCIGQDSITVFVVTNETAYFPTYNPICAGDAFPPLPISSVNLIEGTWAPPINNLQTTTYTFTPLPGICAWDTSTITIVVQPLPVLTSQDVTTCIGKEVNISSTPYLPNGTFTWSNNSTANQFNITADTSTFYTVTYTLNGCTSQIDTVKVVVNTLPLVSITPNAPTTFCAQSSVNLSSSYNYGNLWSTSENTQSITASSSGTYQVIVTDSNGCVDSASITITNTGVPCLQIGGVFTPNGDGTNDTCQIIGIENYPDATVEIFNRWGQQLFYSKGYNTPWNGTYNNEKLPTGDYFYIIDLGINDPIKGALTIKN
jgi:gliding motility-associated-like protein